MSPKTIRIAVLGFVGALLAIGAVAVVAQSMRTANVEVVVWRGVDDGALYASARVDGGEWRTGNAPLDLSRRSASGRFDVSAPVALTVPLPGDDALSMPDDATAMPDDGLFRGDARTANGIRYTTREAADGSLSTILDVTDVTAADGAEDFGELFLRCRGGELVAFVLGHGDGDGLAGYAGDTASVTFAADGGEAVTQTWAVINNHHAAVAPSPDAITEMLAGASMLTVRVEAPDGGVNEYEFDVTGLFETPAQPNFASCGL